MKQYLTGLHHFGIPTTDIDGTVAFYQKLGAEILFEKTDEDAGRPIRVVLLKLADFTIETYERQSTAKEAGAIDHIAIHTDHIEKAYQSASESGLRFLTEGIQASSYWPEPLRYFIVIGCNGEKVEICQTAG